MAEPGGGVASTSKVPRRRPVADAASGSPEPISHKREWLDRLVQSKLAGRSVRYYQEPVVLLDE